MRRGIPTARAGLLSATLILLAAGCSVLAPQPDHSRYYVLSPIVPARAESAATESPGQKRLVIGLGPIRFPDYLDRPQMVMRVGANQLQLSETDRWAEPLQTNFARVLSQNLSALLGTVQVFTRPWLTNVQLDYEVPIEVLQFDSDRKGKAKLLVRWAIKDVSKNRVVFSSDSHFDESLDESGTEAAVGALSNVVGRLSSEIAAAIQKAAS